MDQVKQDYADVAAYLDEHRDSEDPKPKRDVAYLEWIDMMVLNPALEDQYGNYQFEAARQIKAAFTEKWGPDIYKWVQGELHRDFPPVVTALYDAKDYLAPYWDIETTMQASGKYPVDAAQQHEWVLREMGKKGKDGVMAAQYYDAMERLRTSPDPAKQALYSKYRNLPYIQALYTWADDLKTNVIPTVASAVGKEREQWRRANPKGEAYLELFYDLQPIAEQKGG